MAKKIKQHQKEGETIMIYAYVAGHGVADNQQYFLLNTDIVKDALYPIELTLRTFSKIGKGKCFVFAVYDICRLSSASLRKKATE